MPDELVKQMDRRAKDEHRTRSELLREAVQQHLATAASGGKKLTFQSKNRKRKGQRRKKWTKEALQQYLLDRGIVQKGCPGLDAMLGPVKGPVDMRRVLEIGRKLTGLTRQIIADREDRV
jgi:predicted DNA-binding protein